MYSFGSKSLERLENLDPRLQEVLHEAIKLVDFSVLETHRNEQRQNRLFREGKSKLKWPNSKHNTKPSLAVDVAPYPIDWDNPYSEFQYLAGIIMGIAHEKGLKLRWGGDWNQNGELSDNSFNDLPHLEIVNGG